MWTIDLIIGWRNHLIKDHNVSDMRRRLKKRSSQPLLLAHPDFINCERLDEVKCRRRSGYILSTATGSEAQNPKANSNSFDAWASELASSLDDVKQQDYIFEPPPPLCDRNGRKCSTQSLFVPEDSWSRKPSISTQSILELMSMFPQPPSPTHSSSENFESDKQEFSEFDFAGELCLIPNPVTEINEASSTLETQLQDEAKPQIDFVNPFACSRQATVKSTRSKRDSAIDFKPLPALPLLELSESGVLRRALSLPDLSSASSNISTTSV